MAKLIDLTGKTFSRLKVIGRTENIGKRTAWLCECSCDEHNRVIVLGYNLTKGKSKSCGCLRQEVLSEVNRTHGYTHTREYNTWQSMKGRCLYPSHKSYKDYGGRGISVCTEWLESFETFLKDMGKRPEGTEIDRIDVNGNYEPSNCRWISKKGNNNNKRRDIGKKEDK